MTVVPPAAPTVGRPPSRPASVRSVRRRGSARGDPLHLAQAHDRHRHVARFARAAIPQLPEFVFAPCITPPPLSSAMLCRRPPPPPSHPSARSRPPAFLRCGRCCRRRARRVRAPRHHGAAREQRQAVVRPAATAVTPLTPSTATGTSLKRISSPPSSPPPRTGTGAVRELPEFVVAPRHHRAFAEQRQAVFAAGRDRRHARQVFHRHRHVAVLRRRRRPAGRVRSRPTPSPRRRSAARGRVRRRPRSPRPRSAR